MKKLSVIALLLCSTVCVAQTHRPDSNAAPVQNTVVTIPTVLDFHNALANCTLWNLRVDKPAFYKNLSFKDADTKKVTKFTELSEMEKNLYYVYNAEQLSTRMSMFYFKWSFELAKIKYEEKQGKTRPATKNGNKIATKKDIEDHLARLDTLRKKHAVEFEKLIAKVFEKYKNEIPEKDRKTYSERIRKWHDSQKLIVRKKEKKKEETKQE